MALGANRREVLRAINLTHVMQGMVFGISTLEPATLIAVAVTFTIIALLASWLPARRATKIDPLVALRFE